MMYECKHCGMWFFLEEGYEPETDMIVCPSCGTAIEEN
jgi:DNA-directed RNA polymerase subunit RPC12/RpoP